MKDCFAVTLKVLFDAEKRESLKEIAMDALENESHMVPFASYEDYDVETQIWQRNQLILPGNYAKSLEWPKDKQIRYAGTLLIGDEPRSDKIFFNSIESLLSTIELIENAEQKPKSLWQKFTDILS